MVKWLIYSLKSLTGYHYVMSLTVKFWLAPISLYFNPLSTPTQVMHGGLFSNDDVTLDDLRKIDRNRQPPEEGNESIFDSCTVHSLSLLFIIGLMCELLWSDPQDMVLLFHFS